MQCDCRVSLIDPLPANLVDQSLDLLGRDVQVGEFGQITGRLLIRNTVDACMDGLLQDARAEVGLINPQRLSLRGKKPADIGGNSPLVGSTRRSLAWS